MARGTRTGSIPRHLACLAVVAVALVACGPTGGYPPTPKPLRPTIVGIIATKTQDSVGYHFTLTDGSVVDAPQNNAFLLMGSSQPGYLLVADMGGAGFADSLHPLGSGCWDASQAPGGMTAWDMGETILFMNGLELPKAPGYHADLEPKEIDGRLGWSGDRNVALTFCANSRGQIEWVDKGY